MVRLALVGRAHRAVHILPSAARTRPLLSHRRRRLVARYQVLGVRVRQQSACVRPPLTRADGAAGTRALENALHRIRAAYACMQAQRGRDDRPRAFGVREGDGRVDWHALSPGHERRCLHAHLVCEQLPTPTLALPRPSCAQLRCCAQPGGHPLSRMHARRIRATLGARSPRFLRSLAYDHNDARTCAASRSLLHRIPGVDRRVAEPHGR